MLTFHINIYSPSKLQLSSPKEMERRNVVCTMGTFSAYGVLLLSILHILARVINFCSGPLYHLNVYQTGRRCHTGAGARHGWSLLSPSKLGPRQTAEFVNGAALEQHGRKCILLALLLPTDSSELQRGAWWHKWGRCASFCAACHPWLQQVWIWWGCAWGSTASSHAVLPLLGWARWVPFPRRSLETLLAPQV